MTQSGITILKSCFYIIIWWKVIYCHCWYS